MTVGATLTAVAARLRAAGIEGARFEARLLVEKATGLGREAQLREPERPLSSQALAALDGLVARRCARAPLAHVLGEREFWSLPLAVGPGVLVPRPETETVVEAVLAARPGREVPRRLLDLGTGSGCLLLALLHEWPNAFGIGVDRSPVALACAAANIRRHRLERRAALIRGDWSGALSGPFDVIVANPPYVALGDLAGLAPEVRVHEPREALAAGPDGLAAYRALTPDLARLLAPGGLVALEIGQGQGEAVAALLARHGLAVHGQVSDLAGIQRCLLAGPA